MANELLMEMFERRQKMIDTFTNFYDKREKRFPEKPRLNTRNLRIEPKVRMRESSKRIAMGERRRKIGDPNRMHRTTPARIQTNSRVRKTSIDAKNAITTLDKLKAGTAPTIDKLQRFMNNTHKSAKITYTKIRGPRMMTGLRAGGMMGLGLAGVMGLSLALSKTRHGREQ